MMMNIVALGLLLSSLGSVMVLSPEPMLVKNAGDGEGPLQAAKDATQGIFLKAEETLGSAKDSVVEAVTKPVERVGWFRRKPKPEDHLDIAREKAAAAKDAFQEASAQLKDATLEKMGTTAETAKDEATDAYHETGKYVGDKTSQATGAVKDAAGRTQEWVEDSTQTVYEKAGSAKDATYDAAGAAKDRTKATIGRANQKAKEGAEDAYESASDTLGSAKDRTYETLGSARDSVYDAAGYVKEKVHDIIVGTKDNVHDASVAAKDKTADAVGSAKDSIYGGAEGVRDAVVDTVQLGVDKSKGTATNAAEKVKETSEAVAHETREAGHGILGKVREAACKTAECLRARAQEAGSLLPNIGQGVGYAYDRKAAGGDLPGFVKETANNAAGNVGELGENGKAWTKEGAQGTIKSAKRAYEGARDKAGDYYQDAKDRTSDKYDSARDTAQEYYDEAGRRYRSARDYYGGSGDFYGRGRGGRNYYNSARNIPSRYYDAAKDEAEDYHEEFKDRSKHVYRDAKDRAGEYYDDVRDRLGSYYPGRYYESGRDYYGGERQRFGDAYRSARDTAEDYYEGAKSKPSNELSAMVESMGWRRVGVVPHDENPTSSSEEIVIGDVKYVWPGKGRAPRETVFNRVTNSVKDAAHTVGEKLGLAKEQVKDTAENVREGGARARDQAFDSLRAPRDDGRWRRRFREDEDSINDEDDDSLIYRGARNVRDGIKRAGKEYVSQRSKAGEYADAARQELQGMAGYGDEDKTAEGRRPSRTWKDDLFRRPVGFILALIRVLHLFTFSTIYGSAFWVTFVSGLILSKHIPRQQFGYVQSRMFPIYLRILAGGQSLLFLLHSFMHPWFSANNVEQWQLLNFATIIASTLINAYVLEPRATKVMFERLKVEKEEGRGLDTTLPPTDAKQVLEDHKKKLVSINEQFKTLHGYSSALNLISLAGLTWHLWHLARRLVI